MQGGCTAEGELICTQRDVIWGLSANFFVNFSNTYLEHFEVSITNSGNKVLWGSRTSHSSFWTMHPSALDGCLPTTREHQWHAQRTLRTDWWKWNKSIKNQTTQNMTLHKTKQRTKNVLSKSKCRFVLRRVAKFCRRFSGGLPEREPGHFKLNAL